MAAPYTQKSDLDADVQVYYNKTLLTPLVPRTMYYNHCDKQLANVPMKSGETVEFMKYPRITPVTTALSQTSDGTGKTITRTKVRATLLEYGDHTILTKYVKTTDIDSEVEGHITNTFARQMAESYDLITREVMLATAQEYYANGTTSGTIAGTDKANIVDVKKLNAKMRQNDVLPYSHEGSEDMYHFITSPAQAYDIKADTTAGGFIDINKYHNSEALRKGPTAKGLYGVVDGTALYETTLTKAETVNSVPVHCALMLGAQAYACPEIDEAKAGVKVIPPKGGTNDVHERFTVISWYGLFVPVSLDKDAASNKNKRAFVYRSAYTSL